MKVDHIGVAVRSLEKGIAFWEKVFGYEQATEMVINTRQKVKVVFLKKEGNIDIKLIEPLDETSPIYAFTQKGGGVHHICFKCDSMDDELERLIGLRLRVIAKPQPGEAFDNEKIAFLYSNGLNIELIDTDKRVKELQTLNHEIQRIKQSG